MTDTAASVERRYRERLLARSGADRVRMAASLHTTARALVRASILSRRPEATEADVRAALFLRFYADDFSPAARARVLAWLGRHAAPWAVVVSLDELELALTQTRGEWTCYLDTATGETLMIPIDRSGFDGDWPSPAALDEGVGAGRLLVVEPLASHDKWIWMTDFAASAPDAVWRERLERALRGTRAFRAFKAALADRPAERERWFRFEAGRLRAAAEEWLRARGIEVTP